MTAYASNAWPYTYTSSGNTAQTIYYSVQQGWECPRCHRIHSPSVASCWCEPYQYCIICQSKNKPMSQAPYGSQHDGDPVCNDCLSTLIDDAVRENRFRQENG